MSIDDLKSLLDGFDPASLLPELDTVVGKVALAARIAVMIGPVILLALGLIYLLAAPREANYYIGYRCYYGMGSVEAWRFTQRLAGLVWGGLGLVLSIVMLLICGSFARLPVMDMLWKAGRCLLWEAGLIAAACITINSLVAARYDANGARRKAKGRRSAEKRRRTK